MATTRLGLTGTPTRLYGDFSGKSEAAAIDGDEITTAVAYFARSVTSGIGAFARTVTGQSSDYARTVTTQDAER